MINPKDTRLKEAKEKQKRADEAKEKEVAARHMFVPILFILAHYDM
jgi:hypothetical protein